MPLSLALCVQETALIFIFLDDTTLDVVDEPSEINGKYEGIDVEDGLYCFFDDQLRRMNPRFTVPNSRSLFGFIVTSGTYQLEAGGEDRDGFLDRLSKVSFVNPNPHFQSVDAIRKTPRSTG